MRWQNHAVTHVKLYSNDQEIQNEALVADVPDHVILTMDFMKPHAIEVDRNADALSRWSWRFNVKHHS